MLSTPNFEGVGRMGRVAQRRVRSALGVALVVGWLGGALALAVPTDAGATSGAVTLYVRSSSTGTTCTSATSGASEADACGQIQTAVTEAETVDASKAVTVTVGPGTFAGGIDVSGSLLSSLTIQGAGTSATSIAGNEGGGDGGGVTIASGTVEIRSVTFSDDSTDHCGGGVAITSGAVTLTSDAFSTDSTSPTGFGGGVCNRSGTATLTSDTFSHDTAENGGAVYNEGTGVITLANDLLSTDHAATAGGAVANAGVATLTDDTLSQDSSGTFGGAITSADDAHLTLTDDTLSTDHATFTGGAVFGGGTFTNDTFYGDYSEYGGAIYAEGSVTLVYDTLAQDTVEHSPNGTPYSSLCGGGLDGAAEITATLIDASVCDASGSTGDYNVTTTSTFVIGATSKWVNPTYLDLTSTLAINTSTGPETLALLTGSPAIDAVKCTGLPSTDERGAPRLTSGTRCDAGAYQGEKVPPPVTLYVRTGSGGTTCTTGASGTAAGDACGQIQEAVTKAESDSGAVVVTVGPNTSSSTYAGEITITTEETELTSLTIKGAGADATKVTGQGSTRDFEVNSYGELPATVTIEDMAIDGGYVAGTNGGGVYNGGTLTLTDDSLSTDATTYNGGGVYNGGTLTLNDDTFSHDSADDTGGGVSDYGTASATHDTFSTDTAGTNGGGFTNSYARATLSDDTFSHDSAAFYGGGAGNWGTGTITHDTFSHDSAEYGAGVINDGISPTLGIASVTNDTFSDDAATYGGGVMNGFTGYGKLSLVYDTFAGDTAVETGSGVFADAGTTTLTGSLFDAASCVGKFTSTSNYDVATTPTCKIGATSIQATPLDVTPTLEPNTSTGPETLALLSGSPAVDAVTCTGLPLTDERGISRPASGKRCDAGAYQAAPSSLSITSPATGATEASPTVMVSGSAPPTTTVVVSASGTEPATASTTADSSGIWSTTVTALKGTDTLLATDQTTGTSSAAVHITVESNTLVVNGGFGTPTVTSSTHVSQLTAIYGWTSTNSCDIELQSEPAHSVEPFTGDHQYAALASNCTSGVVQTIATTPGQDYVLSFAYRAQPTTAATQNTMSVQWGTSTINWGTPTSPVTTLQGTTTGLYDGWRLAQDIVKATSTTTKLQFVDTASTSELNEGDFLDGVSLAPFYPAKATNTSWQSALTISTPSETTTSATRALAFSDEHLWYKFQIEPDEQLSVQLKNLPADDDLLLFSDITAAYSADTTPTTAGDLTELQAESPTETNPVDFASAGMEGGSAGMEGGSAGMEGGSAGMEGGSAGMEGGSAGMEGGSAGMEGGSAGMEGGPAGLTAGSAGMEGGSAGMEGGSAGMEGGSAGMEGGAAQLALEQTFIGLSQQQGEVTKIVNADTYNDSGVYYAEVIGLNGAYSPTAFTIAVTQISAVCSTVTSKTLSTPVPTTTFPTSTGGTLSGHGSNYTTVILTDSQTMTSVTKTTTLSSDLSRLADTTHGVVVNVGKSTAVQELTTVAENHPTCPYAVNREAEAIQNIVNSYRSGANPKYVVIVGGDTVIPFFRYADQETVEPESEFTHVISLTTHTEAEAALEDNYYLTDDPYGSVATLTIDGSTLPLQTAAVGRLVQTPQQIERTIDRYLTTATGKVIKVTSSLSAGYSFMAKPASTIATTFATEEESVPGASDTQLITKDGVPTSQIGTAPTTSWTANRLSTKLTSKSHQLVFIGAHFNSKVMLAADHTTGVATYLTTTTFSKEIDTHLSGALVLSAGCHSGYNVNPADSVVGTTVAWPEAFTNAGATLIAGSGYQYSDVNYVADSDQVYADLAKQLDYQQTTGGVHIGTALLHTEWEYLASLESLDGLAAKSLLQVTLYGLPMLGIQFGSTAPKPAPGEAASVIGTSTVTTPAAGPGKALKLGEASLHVTADITEPPIKPSTTVGTATRVYYKGPAGDTSEPGTPVVPVQTVNVTVPTKTLRGVGLWKGSYSDASDSAQPLVGDPAAETAPTPPTFSSTTYAPGKIWNPNYFGTLTSGTGTTLGITPIQYVTTPAHPKKATKRTYSTLTFLLFYSSETGTAAGSPAPAIGNITVTTTGTTVTVSATVPGNEAAGVQEVWTTYTDPGVAQKWTSTSLAQTKTVPARWKATFSDPDASSSDFMVQAVNGVGEVSMNNSTGAYYTPAPAGQPVPATYTLSLASATGTYGTTATLVATLTAQTSSGDAADRPISFSIGTKGTTAYTNTAGVATGSISLAGLVPGTYPVSASFEGNGANAPAHVTSVFEITKASTTLVLSTPSSLRSGGPSGVTATLTSHGHPLGQESVFFTVTNPTGVIVASSVGTTTNAGIAQAGAFRLPAGDVGTAYLVHAYFATATTPVSALGKVDASVLGYDAAIATPATVEATDATKTTLVATPTSPTSGKRVELTATISPTGTSTTTWPTGAGEVHPTGTVTFEDGSTVLGKASITLSAGGVASATLTLTTSQSGTNTLTATYAGNTYLGASSGTLALTVAPKPVKVTVSGTQTFGSSRPTFEAITTPTDVALGGSLTCTIVTPGAKAIGPTLPVGKYTINGTSCSGATVPSGYTIESYTGTASGFVVSQSSTTTTVSFPATTTYATETATVFHVKVTVGSGGVSPSGEKVAVKVGGASCTATLTSGSGSCSLSVASLPVGGPYPVSASYGGDSNLLGSSTTGQSITVVAPDHPGCSGLSGANLEKKDLVGDTLAGCSLTGSNLESADLAGANLKGASLTGSNLEDATLTGADLATAKLSGANLAKATLSYADLAKATLEGDNLADATLPYAVLTGATMKGADLADADMAHDGLQKADAAGSNFAGATLLDAAFTGANVSGCNFAGADVKGATFTGATEKGATF